MSDRYHIRREVRGRGISRLCHFTRGESLGGILGSIQGIMSRRLLDARAVGYRPVDSRRWDGYLDYVSCSIEYPNTRYMVQADMRDSSELGWVVLGIEPVLLEKADTLFCHCNAATGRGRYVGRGYHSFLHMFSNAVMDSRWIYERTRKMLACCPTNDQAEVLVYGCVPRNLITEVIAPDEDTLELLYEEVEDINFASELEWMVSPDLFTEDWIDLVASGERPVEYYAEI